MAEYACRDDNYSMKPVPADKSRQEVYCPDCKNAPYKGPDCLLGRSYEAREQIRKIVERREKEAVYARNEGKRLCLLCGYALDRSTFDTRMHRECARKVIGRMVAANKHWGMNLTEAHVIRMLMEEGLDTPPV